MLEYVALAALLLSITAIFYIFIFIHDLPHRVAKKRHHPQEEAIHYACWLSLFTLHAIWPLVFMWAVSNRGPLPVKVVSGGEAAPSPTPSPTPTPSLAQSSAPAPAPRDKVDNVDDIKSLREAVVSLQTRLSVVEQQGGACHG